MNEGFNARIVDPSVGAVNWSGVLYEMLAEKWLFTAWPVDDGAPGSPAGSMRGQKSPFDTPNKLLFEVVVRCSAWDPEPAGAPPGVATIDPTVGLLLMYPHPF